MGEHTTYYKIFGCEFAICFGDVEFEKIVKFIYPHYLQKKVGASSQHIFYLDREKEGFLIYLDGTEQFRTTKSADVFSYLEWSITCLALRESRQFLQLHAGCISRSNEGIILVGKTGNGKTTLVYHLLERGLRCLADDILFVSTDEKQLYPFKRAFLVKAGLQKMTGLAGYDSSKEDNSVFFSNNIAYFHPGIRYKDCWSQPVSKVGAVVFLNYSEDKRFFKAQKYLAAEWLLKAVFNLCFLKDKACTTVADLINNSQTFCLYSNDIEWSASMVCSLFDKLPDQPSVL